MKDLNMSFRSVALTLAFVGSLFAVNVFDASRAQAGDPETLGMFALLDDADVRASLALTPAVETAIAQFLDEREQLAAQFEQSIRSLSVEEQRSQLAAFAAESERLGAQFLDDEQNDVLRRWYLALQGMKSLADDTVAAKLGLTDEQRGSINDLLTARRRELNDVSGIQRDLINNRYEVELAKVLTTTQFAGWRIMAGDTPSVNRPLEVNQNNNDVVAELASQSTPQDDDTSNENDGTLTPADGNASAPAPAIGSGIDDDDSAQGDPGDENNNRDDPQDDDVTSEEGIDDANSGNATNDTSLGHNVASQDEPIIRFTFGKTEWADVLEWFAEQADLSLYMDIPPEGTFNYQDDVGIYTVSEGLDQINHVLLTRGYTLVRNRKMLMLVDLSDDIGIPEAVIETVTPEELAKRGKYEVMRCIFNVSNVDADNLEDQIEALIEDDERYGRFFPVTSANRIVIQSTGDKLRLVKQMLEAAEAKADRSIGTYELIHVTAEEVMIVARPLLGFPADDTTNQDGTLRVAIEGFGTRLFYQGNAETVALFEQIIEEVDRDPGGEDTEPDLPYLRGYEVRADPQTVYEVLQTMLAGYPEVRMQVDAITGNIILRARQAEHEIAQNTIDEMQRRTVGFLVIQLRDYDPVSMISIVEELLRLNVEGADLTGPTLEADPIKNQLIVRGTPQEVDEVKSIVEGLDPPRGAEGIERLNVRVLPFVGRDATDAIDWAETMWESQGRSNRLRIVMPEDRRGILDQREVAPLEGSGDAEGSGDGDTTDDTNGDASDDSTGSDDANTPNNVQTTIIPIPHSEEIYTVGLPPSALQEIRNRTRSRFDNVSYTSYRQDDQEPNRFDRGGETRIIGQDSDEPEIIVRVMPYGIIIESDDLDALDAFEDLIYARPLVELPTMPTIFYLKNRSADQAEALLKSILGISTGGGGGIGNLFGDMAQNILPGGAGDLLGGLLGPSTPATGGSGAILETTGPVDIVADAGLNALLVRANEDDLDLIEGLLSYIDQPEAPQGPNTDGQTYVIEVVYQNAQDLLTIIQNQLSDRIRSPRQGGGEINPQQLQQQFIQQLLGGRGGRGGGGGGGGGVEVEEAKMAVSVDATTNSILVTGPEYLYEQVLEICQKLDRPEIHDNNSMSVIQIGGNINPAVLQSALSEIFPNVESTSQGGTTTSVIGGGRQGGGNIQMNPQQRQQLQELQQRLQGNQGGIRVVPGGGGGGGRGGRGGRGG